MIELEILVIGKLVNIMEYQNLRNGMNINKNQ